jgi:hypothetical protein
MTVHGPEYGLGTVLKGNIKIGKKPGVPSANIQDRPGKIIRMYIEEPYPERAFQGRDSFQELGKPRRRGEAASSVGSQILTNKADLPDAPPEEPPALIQHMGNRAGPQGTPDKGNGAEGAAVIAALGNFNIGGPRQG